VRYLLGVFFFVASCSVQVGVTQSPDAETSPPPYAVEGAEIGRTYPLAVMTHCGLSPVWVNGEMWQFDVARPGTARDATGFEEPWDLGTVRLLDGDRAVFRRSDGAAFGLTRHPRPWPSLMPCA
jgi:hypothetical protein